MITIKKITMLIVAITLFMDVMDTNVMNTAVPAIAHTFKVNPIDIKVALISYLLSFAIFIPTSGWISDRYGLKRIFISALCLFTAASFFCGFAKTLPEIILARFIQGIGGAFMVSLGRLMIARTFRRNELVDAMNMVIMVVSIAVMLGPFIGGFIVDHWSWSWIFWVNIPVGIALILLSHFCLKDHHEKLSTHFDFFGFILFGGGLALLCFSLSEMSESHPHWRATFLQFCIALMTILCYVFYAINRENPIIQLKLFRLRTFRISVIGNLCSRLGFGGIPFLFPLMQQVSFGFSAQLSGLLLVPIAFGIIFSKMLAIKLLRKMGYRYFLIANTFIVACVLCLFQVVTVTTPLLVIALLTFIFGLFISGQYTAMNSLAFSDIPDEKLSASTSITSTVQILGQSLGVAAGAILLRVYSPPDLHGFLPAWVFHRAFLTLGIITFLSMIVFIPLQLKDGIAMLIKEKEAE